MLTILPACRLRDNDSATPQPIFCCTYKAWNLAVTLLRSHCSAGVYFIDPGSRTDSVDFCGIWTQNLQPEEMGDDNSNNNNNNKLGRGRWKRGMRKWQWRRRRRRIDDYIDRSTTYFIDITDERQSQSQWHSNSECDTLDEITWCIFTALQRFRQMTILVWNFNAKPLIQGIGVVDYIDLTIWQLLYFIDPERMKGKTDHGRSWT